MGFLALTGSFFWVTMLVAFATHGCQTIYQLQEKERDLQKVYERVYHKIPWPHSIPKPSEITLRWNSRFITTGIFGVCRSKKKIIEINIIFQDKRLKAELEDLMAHEAAHFIWGEHPKAFTDFLRSAGVSERYVHDSVDSEMYRALKAKYRPHRHTLELPCPVEPVVEFFLFIKAAL